MLELVGGGELDKRLWGKMRISFHRQVADNTSSDSVATRLRRKRFEILEGMLSTTEGTVSVLDVGGRGSYWDQMLTQSKLRDRMKIVMLNVDEQENDSRYEMMVGDARSMPQFADDEFDVVFSNSTIEHVGTWDDQVQMANELRRIGKRYYVQTPYKYFPVEPHYVVPMFQFLPIGVRASLVQRFALGWMPKHPDRDQAIEAVSSIRLLTKTQMEQLFPDGEIVQERVAGLVKSVIAYR